ncbi:MAG: hypothetical protein COY40_02605 [Alphaproteobacteria bacterium CG_4_10_14_0_8_um_filter_53_9]|nr:MAG: hypothetical protein COY40_02605 [Alphaproteobacteria bacterium CG_4_10_14_0_8_um_filter_53_9]
MKQVTDARVEGWLEAAAEAARASVCCRRRCGSVLVDVASGDVLMGAENARPAGAPVHCDPYALASGFKSDKACCVHAEQRLVMQALREGVDMAACDLVFTSVDAAGERLVSGKPYCTICSKMVLEAGVRGWILDHEDGPIWYEAGEYNALSFRYDGE